MQSLNIFSAKRPHLAFLPSGLGSFTGFFRLASLLASSSCEVTFILIQPQPSSNDDFFIKHPQIKRIDFEIPPSIYGDCIAEHPFMARLEAIDRSLHLLLHQTLDSLEPAPIAAIFSDFSLAATLTRITSALSPLLYIVSTTSAKTYSTVAYLPVLISDHPDVFSSCHGDFKIPGLAPIRLQSVPPALLDHSPVNYLEKSYLLPNAQSLPKVNGVLLNTFDWFETETITALNSGRVLSDLPPVFPIGPLEPYELDKGHQYPWLDENSPGSVIYVDFGSKGTMETDQMKELAKGLVMCRHGFLWVIRTNQDKGHYVNDDELRDLFGDSLAEEMNNNGKVLKGGVKREDILAHPSVGGFVNQCEWESVMDAAREGVPILAWPQECDHKMNAEVVEKAGLGIWVRDWGWAGEKLVKSEEITDMLKKMMTDSRLRDGAKKVKEAGQKASKEVLMEVIEILKSSDTRSYD